MKKYKVGNTLICVGQIIKFNAVKKSSSNVAVINNMYTGRIKSIKGNTVTIDCSEQYCSNIQTAQLEELTNVEVLKNVEE